MKIYDRKTESFIEEKEYQEGLLNFLYTTFIGRVLLKLVVARPWFSKLRTRYQRSPKSCKDIEPFIEEYKVDITPYVNSTEPISQTWKNFNDFFIRQRKIENVSSPNELVAVADSKLSAYKIEDNLQLKIKNSIYTLNEIVQNKIPLDEFKGGTALVFRLSVYDYHRYVFCDEGRLIGSYKIKGELHTVRPVSEKYKVYARNSRVVNELDTKNFGKVIQVEVGALLVGCIRNHEVNDFTKLQEKGYFEYGGSTIILLVKNNVVIDKDILERSADDIETKVQIGEKIGEIIT